MTSSAVIRSLDEGTFEELELEERRWPSPLTAETRRSTSDCDCCTVATIPGAPETPRRGGGCSLFTLQAKQAFTNFGT